MFIRLRATESQRRRLLDGAANAGLDLSNWLRMVALAAAGQAGIPSEDGHPPAADQPRRPATDAPRFFGMSRATGRRLP